MSDDRVKASAPMTESAQAAARRFLEAALDRAEMNTRFVSGEGEAAEIYATILAMLDNRERLRAALQRIVEEDHNGRGQSDGNFSDEAFENARAALT